MADSVLKVFFV